MTAWLAHDLQKIEGPRVARDPAFEGGSSDVDFSERQVWTGLDPDAVERRARARGAKVVQPVTTKGHGWREVMVEDPDGYLWAVGVPGPSTRGS